jgi:Ca2+-binding EF-hand superfamily protein
MNTVNRIGSLVAWSLAMFAMPIAQAEHGDKADHHFKMMDTNGDGKVTRAEHAAGAKKMFTECDANKDGVVTAAEMDAAMAKRGDKAMADDKSSAEKIKVIDQNGDGKLTAAEHDAGTEKMFAKMDTNGDGMISKEECAEGMKMMKKGT